MFFNKITGSAVPQGGDTTKNGDVFSNFDLSGTSRRCLCRSFRPPFSKGGADPTRGALVASAEAKQTTAFSFAKLFFCANGNKRKADVEHKKGIRRKRNPVLLIVTVCPLFSLTPEAQMKTGYATLRRKSLRDSRLAKKKCRKRNFASAEATNAPRVGLAVAF